MFVVHASVVIACAVGNSFLRRIADLGQALYLHQTTVFLQKTISAPCLFNNVVPGAVSAEVYVSTIHHGC